MTDKQNNNQPKKPITDGKVHKYTEDQLIKKSINDNNIESLISNIVNQDTRKTGRRR